MTSSEFWAVIPWILTVESVCVCGGEGYNHYTHISWEGIHVRRKCLRRSLLFVEWRFLEKQHVTWAKWGFALEWLRASLRTSLWSSALKSAYLSVQGSRVRTKVVKSMDFWVRFATCQCSTNFPTSLAPSCNWGGEDSTLMMLWLLDESNHVYIRI